MGRKTTSGMSQGERLPKVAAMRISGASQRAIAEALSVSPDTVGRDLAVLEAGWKEAASPHLQRQRGLDLARLERLILAAWPAALSGHVPSIKVTVELIQQRAALLGLDAPEQTKRVTKPSPLHRRATRTAPWLMERLSEDERETLMDLLDRAGAFDPPPHDAPRATNSQPLQA